MRKTLVVCLFVVLLPVFTVALSSSDPICSIHETLAHGSRGTSVTILQNFLRERGTFHVEATGYFGPITEAALANWQLDVGIITRIQDGGVFGPRTRQYFRNQGCTAPIPAPTTKAPATKTTPTKTTPPQKAESKATAKVQEEQCIAPPEKPLLTCSLYWTKTFDAKSCHVGWTCVSGAATSTTTTSAPKPPVNKPPFIYSITGPTRLKTGEAGTWIVTASDPEYEAIEYSVIWGDEGGSLAQLLELARLGIYTFSRQTTYTHTYEKSGAFTIVVFARDTMNNDTKATLSILVEAPPPPPSPPPTNTNNTNTTNGGASCIGYGGTSHVNGSVVADDCLKYTDQTQYNLCQVSAHVKVPIKCQNGQWVSGAQTTGASCVVHRHCGDLIVPDGGIAGNSRACGVVCSRPSQCVNGTFVPVGTYATPHQYETSCPDDPFSL